VDRTARGLDRLIGSKASRLGTRIALGLLAIYVLWGSTFLAIRVAVETIPPLLMCAARWLLAGSFLYVFACSRGAERPKARHWATASVMGALLVFFSNGGVTWAETRVPSGVAALFIASVSFWMVLLDWLRPGGTRPAPRVALGVVAGFLGVALLVGRHGEGVHVDPLGAGVLLFSALSWSIGSLVSTRIPRPSAPLLAASMQMLAGGAYLAIAGLASGERVDASRVSVLSVGALLYLAVFGSLVGFTIYLWLMRVAAPSLVATYACVNPVVAVFLGAVLLHEPITLRMLVATAAIVGAVALIVSARRKPAQNRVVLPSGATARAEA
jgi:drug/metabolite transporter (DMT)-like permease